MIQLEFPTQKEQKYRPRNVCLHSNEQSPSQPDIFIVAKKKKKNIG